VVSSVGIGIATAFQLFGIVDRAGASSCPGAPVQEWWRRSVVGPAERTAHNSLVVDEFLNLLRANATKISSALPSRQFLGQRLRVSTKIRD
jgi:hypothetical protein